MTTTINLIRRRYLFDAAMHFLRTAVDDQGVDEQTRDLWIETAIRLFHRYDNHVVESCNEVLELVSACPEGITSGARR